jgi:hypothetical protein
MRCDVCGLDYSTAHNCPGPISENVQRILAEGLEAPSDGGFGYYLGEAWKIVRWDDIAIRRNAKDPRATFYATLIWLMSLFVALLGTSWPTFGRIMDRGNTATVAVALIIGLSFGLLMMAAITFAQLSLCHLIAKWIFGAKGTFIEIMRPLLLGSFVNCLMVIPAAGVPLAGIGWTAVLMMVFEEVDGIGRLQAFGISAGINICVFAIQFAMMPITHHL